MRYVQTLTHRLATFSRSSTATGLVTGLLSWVWTSQFILAWGTSGGSTAAIGVAAILAASTLMTVRANPGAPPPLLWLAIAGWTVVCPFVLGWTTVAGGSVLEDPSLAFFSTLTSALLFLAPGFALLMRALPGYSADDPRAARRATLAAGGTWCLAPLTLGVWPGPHAAAMTTAALLLVRFMKEILATDPDATATVAEEQPVRRWPVVIALAPAMAAGVTVVLVQWVQMQLFLPTAALWCATWGGLLCGAGFGMRAERAGDPLSRAARHCALLALLAGGIALAFPLLLQTAMAISASVSWLPAIVGLRTLVVAVLMMIPGAALGFALAQGAGRSPRPASARSLLTMCCFLGAYCAACWMDVTLLTAVPVAATGCAVAVGLWLLSARSADVQSRVRWTTLAAASLAVVAACLATPASSLPGQRALFSGAHFQARALGVPGELLNAIDDGRMVRSTVTAAGHTAVWTHSGVQWILRENGLTRGIISTQPDLCPQAVPEVLTAVLPLTIHPRPHHILVTSASYPTVTATCLVFPVETVSAVDDNPAAIEFCRESAERVVASLSKGDNRLSLHHADPVRGVATSDRLYDVIISPDSIVGGVASARQWTIEHLRAVAAHLTPDGVYCQRVTCFDLNVPSVLELVKTAQRVFPVVQLNEVAPGEWLLVARPTDDCPLDKTFLERLETFHVRDVLAQAGWDWSIMLSLKTVHPADLTKAASNASSHSEADGRIAYSLPLDVMRWGPKFEQRRQWMAQISRPFGDALGDEPALEDVAKRLSDVKLAQQVMIDHPDQFAAYRHFVKKRLQDRPRPKVIQVDGEGLKNGLDPEDSKRKVYLTALGKAVETKARADVDRLTQFFSPFDPLVTPFIPREFVHIDRQSDSPNSTAQWRCGLRSIFYAPPNDCSVTNVCDALEVMQAHPEVAGSPSAQWDSYNALLEVLKNRWGLRISSSAPLRYGVADAHRTLELAASSLERMDHLHEAAGVSSAEWRTRRAVLEKHLVRPVRSWRSEQSAQFALQAASDTQPIVQAAGAAP